nr:Major Facilitator Superfamily [uncultured organism]
MTRSTGATRFLLTYGLAHAGAVVAYSPFLTLLLPARVVELTGDAHVAWLSAATLLGAVTASVAGILFGWASDTVGSRRRWVAAGLAATLASYVPLAYAETPTALLVAVLVFQVAVNLLLAPLTAWAADAVPDDRKGVLGGLIGAGPPVGALAGVLATMSWLPSEGARLVVVCAIIAALVLPLLVLTPPPAVESRSVRDLALARHDLVLLWVARLLVQVAAIVLFAFLFFYFRALPDAPSQHWIAQLIALALVLGFPLALLVGRISDRLGPRRPFLVGAGVAMAAGLAIMAVAPGREQATAGYILFGCGMSIFLPLQATFAMQLLPRRHRHGLDLGILNLANTLPAIGATLLTAGLVPTYGYPALLWTLSAAVTLAGACVLLVRGDAQVA